METEAKEPEPKAPAKGKKKNRLLPKPRTKYFVGDPVVVIPLAKLEQLANHLTDISLMDGKTQLQQKAIKIRHSLFLKDIRADIKSAKLHYHIVSTSNSTDA